MKLITTIVTLLLCSIQLSAQDLAVSKIPEKLKEGADAVFRFDNQSFTVESLGKGVEKQHFAITIFNQRSADKADIVISYSKLTPVRNIMAVVYDANGEQIKKLKKSEISDYSNFSSYTIYSDSRVKNFDLRQSNYPYTIEVSYEREYDGLLFIPGWVAHHPGKVSVESSVFTVTTPKDYELRIQNVNVEEPVVTTEGNSTVYQWALENATPVESEHKSADADFGYRMVRLAPGKFEMEGFVGDMSSWKSFGKWLHAINKGRDNLSMSHMDEIRSLIGNVTDQREIIKIVYEYLQKNTRYVSIQLGFGGWQTYPASYVAENGYGDCRALTNYTQTVLKNLGIESFYTLISSGKYDGELDLSFPSNQFNHVILSVPMQNDTIWLECTSQNNPFGYLSDFTSDRDALLLSEEGGTIVRTPAYTADENQYITTGEITLDKEGNGKVSMISDFQGLSYDYLDGFNSLSEDNQKKNIRRMFPIKNMEDLTYSYSEEKKPLPESSISVNFNARKIASVSGKRVFLVANQINRLSYIPEKVENRASDFEISYERNVIDSMTYNLPEGIYVERLPAAKKIETEFGTYEVSYEKGDGYLKYVRKYKTNKGVFDKLKYEEYIKFYEQCVRADKQKVVFLKVT
ncbi:MAG: DUF3857 and transglutaminase domain-containing protein [Bacteroidota bacterium]